MKMSHLFPFYFIGCWIIACFVLSKTGWNRLTANFGYEAAFTGKRLGVFSGFINGISYKHILSLTYSEQGLYMRPVLVFRLFHKPVLIPWDRLRTKRIKTGFGRPYVELSLPGRAHFVLYLAERHAAIIAEHLHPAP